MFRRFTSTFEFVNSDGVRQRIRRGWAGEVSDSVAAAADKAGVTVTIGADGKPIMSRQAAMVPKSSPVSDAMVAAEPVPAPAPMPPTYPYPPVA